MTQTTPLPTAPPDPLGILESPAVSTPVGTGTATVPPRVALRRSRAAYRFALLALGGFGLVFAAVKARRTVNVDLAITQRVQTDQSSGFRTVMASSAGNGCHNGYTRTLVWPACRCG